MGLNGEITMGNIEITKKIPIVTETEKILAQQVAELTVENQRLNELVDRLRKYIAEMLH